MRRGCTPLRTQRMDQDSVGGRSITGMLVVAAIHVTRIRHRQCRVRESRRRTGGVVDRIVVLVLVPLIPFCLLALFSIFALLVLLFVLVVLCVHPCVLVLVHLCITCQLFVTRTEGNDGRATLHGAIHASHLGCTAPW